MTTIIPDPQLPRRTKSGMHTRAVNAAAGVLLAAMENGRQTPTGLAIALDSACLLNSPEHATKHEQLLARSTELETLLRQATEFRLWEPGYGLYIRRAPGAAGFGVLEARRTDKGRRCWTTSGWQYSAVLTDPELFCWPDAQTAVAEARRVMPGAGVCETVPFKAQPLTVFRASHDSIVMGLYTTAAAARAHCEDLIRRDTPPSLELDWIEDSEDDTAELVVVCSEGGRWTGYVVTALEVAAAYDGEADE